MDDALQETHRKLLVLRTRGDLTLKPTPLMRTTYKALDGSERAIKLRDYQVQMVFHLLAMRRFVVGDDTGLGKCVVPDTRVSTEQGLLRMGDICPKDMGDDEFRPAPPGTPRVVLPDGTLASVRAFYRGGDKPTRRVLTRRGYTLEGTTVHPVLVRDSLGESYKTLDQLRVGDVVCLRRGQQGFASAEPCLLEPDLEGVGANAKEYPLPKCMTPDLARFLGYLVAEGWVRNKHTFILTQHTDSHPEVHRDMRGLLEKLFGWTGNHGAVSRDTTISVSSIQIVQALRAWGVDPVLSAQKCVPPAIFQATRESVVQFLRGYFDGEASVGKGVVEVTSASEQLIREVQLLLLALGIVATRQPKHVTGYEHTYWRLQFCGDDLREFRAVVGFLTPEKAAALKLASEKKSNPNLDTIPFVSPLVQRLDRAIYGKVGAHGHKGGGIIRFLGHPLRNAVAHVAQGRRDITYRTLGELVDAGVRAGVSEEGLTAARSIIRNHYFYDVVGGIEDATSEVLDIEVDHLTHCFVGNGFINHNTLESIAALAYLWGMRPNTKVIVLTKKSVVNQWAKEFEKFTQGVTVVMCKGPPAQREKAYTEFKDSTGPTVLIAGYRSLVQDFSKVQDWEGYVLIADEATVFKNPGTQVHQVCKHLGEKAERVWGLTATLIKNHLVEGFGIYQVVVPGLFKHTKTGFVKDYCITRMQTVAGGRQVPVIVGYRASDIERFKMKIDPFYLGRPKHEVASELPILQTKDVVVGMTDFQNLKYQEALSGLLTITAKDKSGEEEKETSPLTAIIYCQEIANHPCLIGYDDSDSEKMDALLDMLTDGGEFEEEKVIIFTRFKTLVDWASPYLAKKGIKSVRVTGAEDEEERQAAMDTFQDPDSDVRVIWITMAGGDAINLQAAKALIFYDTPWSAGDYLQILGRMIRIGSIHERVYAVHLIVEDSVDERVQEVLRKKMSLVEAILGKRLKGEDTGVPSDFIVESDTKTLFDSLMEDARRGARK